MKHQRRTPAQLIQDKQAELDKLNARIAWHRSAADPVYAPINAALDALKKDEANSRKTLGKNKQGASARIQKHLLWVARIEAELTNAKTQLQGVKTLRKALRTLLASFVKQKKKPTMAQVAAKVKALINPKPVQAESESENA
jgi:capsule polysaccharide export protein KpsE/RkpR